MFGYVRRRLSSYDILQPGLFSEFHVLALTVSFYLVIFNILAFILVFCDCYSV